MAQNNMADMLQSLLSGMNSQPAGDEAAAGFNIRPDDTADESGGFGGFENLFGNIDIDMIMKIGEIFTLFNKPDKNEELLRALKPHMRDENRKKIDTAIKLMKMSALLPYLRESGLMDKIF